MDWENLRLFLQVAPCRSMTEAAGKTGVSVPTISRRLDVLERETGLKLLKRTPRGLLLTDQGRTLAEGGHGLARELAALQRLVLALRAGATSALVRVSATEPVIAEILAPRLSLLLTRPMAPRVELRVENTIAAIALTDIDIAVRLVRPVGDGLMTRRIATLEFGLFGSAAYLQKLEPPSEGAFGRMAVLSYDDLYGPIPERRWIETAGLTDQIVARMSSTRGLIAATAAGAGVAVLPVMLARTAGLVEVAAPTVAKLPAREVWLVWHRAMTRHAPTRRVLKWITAAFEEARRAAM